MANGNNPAGISTKSPGPAKNHKCISSPQNHSRILMAKHLHPLPGRSGSNSTKLYKKQQPYFGGKKTSYSVNETCIFFFLIPQLWRKKSIFACAPPLTLPKQRRRGGKTSKHHCCPRQTLQEGWKQLLIQDPAAPQWRLLWLAQTNPTICWHGRNIIGSPAKTNSGWLKRKCQVQHLVANDVLCGYITMNTSGVWVQTWGYQAASL